MKRTTLLPGALLPGALLLAATLTLFAACKKGDGDIPAPAATGVAAVSKNGGGGGGNNTPAGPIQNFLSGTAARLVGTQSDSLFVSFTQPVPAGGYTLTVSSSSTAAVVPATVTAQPGAYNVSIPVTGGNVTSATPATITVSLSGQSKTSTITVLPLHFNFSAPTLQSPSNGASAGFHRFITFQWAANNNANYSELQIAEDAAFTNLIYTFGIETNLYPIDYFNGAGTKYWRVRYVDGSGTGGPWSTVRNFVVKPQ